MWPLDIGRAVSWHCLKTSPYIQPYSSWGDRRVILRSTGSKQEQQWVTTQNHTGGFPKWNYQIIQYLPLKVISHQFLGVPYENPPNKYHQTKGRLTFQSCDGHQRSWGFWHMSHSHLENNHGTRKKSLVSPTMHWDLATKMVWTQKFTSIIMAQPA